METGYDEFISDCKSMDVDWLVELANEYRRQCEETALVSFLPVYDFDNNRATTQIQVDIRRLTEVAPAEEWKWEDEDRGDEEYPHEASVVYRDTRFFAIATDEQRESFDGEGLAHLDKWIDALGS